MENDDLIGLLGILTLVFALFSGGVYGAFRYGKTVERRALTSALKQELTEAYFDGLNDGVDLGRTKGWADGVRECDTLPMFSGRY